MSDDRNLSGEEKRAKLKEEYKKELQARREFLDRVEEKRKTASAEKAMASLLGLTESNPLLGDDTDSWINKLRTGAATAEAKVDMLLERLSGEGDASQASPSPAAADAAPAATTATPTPPASSATPPPPGTKTLGDAITGPASAPTAGGPPTPDASGEAKSQGRKTLGDIEN